MQKNKTISTSSGKTVLITSLNPFATRNIMLTDVFGDLKAKPDVKIVLICPDYKIEYFTKHFSAENVVIEGIKTQVISFKDIVFRFIGNNSIDNRTRYIHQKRELIRDKKILKFILARTVALSSHVPFQKKVVQFFNTLFISKTKFKAIFDKYNPDIVFATDIFHDDDVHFLAEAKRRGIKTIAMVRSWDNITNKGLFRIKPDTLIVANEKMRDEAVKYEGMKDKDIFIGGMPQFDYYINEKRSSREVFFKKINLDPDKRLILFSPLGNRFCDTDWHIMLMIKDALDKGELPYDVQVLVRFPPNDDVSLGEFIPDDRFYLERPGQPFKDGSYRDQEMDHDAMIHLADSMHYMDVLVGYTSSLVIDAAAFNKSSISIAFDGFKTEGNIYKSVKRFMEYSHTQYLLKTGGLLVVNNKEELLKAIHTYLNNPDHRMEGRKKILETQTHTFNGTSGKHMSYFIYKELQSV